MDEILCEDGKLRPRIMLTKYLKETYDFTQEDLDEMVRTEFLEASGGFTSQMSSELQKMRIEEGTHPFVQPGFQSFYAKKRMEDGTHNWIGLSAKRVAEGTHNFTKEYAEERTKKLLEEGRHPFQNSEVQRELANRRFICEECGRESTAGGLSAHQKHTGHKGKKRCFSKTHK